MHQRERAPDGAPHEEKREARRAAPVAPAPAQVLALQRRVGNRAVSAVLARQDAPPAAPVVATDEEVLAWPTTLKTAAREAGKKLEVTLHPSGEKQAPTLNDQEGTGGVLSTPGDSDERKKAEAIVEAIKKNRSVDTSFLKLTDYKPKDKPGAVKGYAWNDAGKDTTTPKALEGEAGEGIEGKRKQAQKWVWEEFQHEGGSLSINAYDEMRMTWGRGMAGVHLEGFFQKVISDEKAKQAFLRFGVTFDGTWKIVNVANGAIETGSEALQLMQARPEILAAFKYAAEGNRQAVADAQWGQMSTKGAGKVPDGILDWPKSSIQLMAHIHHGGDARGYPKLDYYKGEGAPDPGALWTGWLKLLSGGAEANGCYVVSAQKHHVAEMRAWGGGAAMQALIPVLRGPFKLTSEQLKTTPELKDQVAMALPDGTFYVWPATKGGTPLTDAQSKALGNDRKEFLRTVNGYPMKELLDALKAREADVKKWFTGGSEIQKMSAGDTNEQRLWFAMHVVVRKTVPPRPQGKDPEGGDLVYKGQVITAYEWLGKKPPAEDKIK